MFADVSLFANGFSVTSTLRKSFLFFSPDHEQNTLTVVVERSLLSLLFIPLLALVFLLVWKVRRTLTPGTKLFNFCRYYWQPILLLVDISLFHGIYNPPENGLSSFCRCRAGCVDLSCGNLSWNWHFYPPNRSDHGELRRILNRILEKMDSLQEQKGLRLL